MTYYRASQQSQSHSVFPLERPYVSAHLPHHQGDELIYTMSSDIDVKLHNLWKVTMREEEFRGGVQDIYS